MTTRNFRGLVRRYGFTAIGTYFTISAATFWSLYFAIENKVDVKGSLQVSPYIPKLPLRLTGLGTVAFSDSRSREAAGREHQMVSEARQ